MIPYCILVIEDDDDRAFMEQLFVDYHRLMYHEIFKLVHDQWAAEDVMQSTLVRQSSSRLLRKRIWRRCPVSGHSWMSAPATCWRGTTY